MLWLRENKWISLKNTMASVGRQCVIAEMSRLSDRFLDTDTASCHYIASITVDKKEVSNILLHEKILQGNITYAITQVNDAHTTKGVRLDISNITIFIQTSAEDSSILKLINTLLYEVLGV